MLNQEEKEYQDFIKKLTHTIKDLKNDLEKLSENNKARVKELVVSSVKSEIQLEVLRLITQHP